MDTYSVSQIVNRIHDSHNILLISHENADGDSLGAALALAHYLEEQEITFTHFTPSPIASYFQFLPKAENLRYGKESINLDDFDTVITLDCGGLSQTTIEDELIRYRDEVNGKTLINIDHHASNEEFGNHNLVLTSASSTSEIMYKLMEKHNIPISKHMATCLLTGLVTDTMNFTNGATTDDSLKIASELLIQGAKMKEITKHVIQNKNILSLKLWGKILERLQIDEDHGVAYTVILQKDIQDSGVEESAIDGLTNFLNNLENVDVIMVLKESTDGFVKGSFRTTKDTVDVAKIAQKLGGGGHKKAAGFRIKARIEEHPDGWELITT